MSYQMNGDYLSTRIDVAGPGGAGESFRVMWSFKENSSAPTKESGSTLSRWARNPSDLERLPSSPKNTPRQRLRLPRYDWVFPEVFHPGKPGTGMV